MTRIRYLPIHSGALGLLLLVAGSSVHAAEAQCVDDSLTQAGRLLEFHFGPDERMTIDPSVELLPAIANPADEREQLSVLEVWGYIYKGRYRMRFQYFPLGDDCLLMGQEIIEFASLGSADAAQGDSGIIRELMLGDRACYVMLEDANGLIDEHMAVMEMCEHEELVDHPVRLVLEQGQVIAASCEGDPECVDSEWVDLIVEFVLE